MVLKFNNLFIFFRKEKGTFSGLRLLKYLSGPLGHHKFWGGLWTPNSSFFLTEKDEQMVEFRHLACSSWMKGINMTLTIKLHVVQNKIFSFILNLKRTYSIRNNLPSKTEFLHVIVKVKQLKMNHVFEIENLTCPTYMLSHFSRLNEESNRMTTRASATDFFLPIVYAQGTSIFVFSAIKEWNQLKNANCGTTFKVKKFELCEFIKVNYQNTKIVGLKIT